MKASIDELIAKMDAASIFYDGDDCAGSNLWEELKTSLPDPTPSSSESGEMEAKITGLEAEVKRLNRLATDRSYMMGAYKAMLGPIAIKVVQSWDKNGVTRQHTSWGPEAHLLTGEERAQVLLDVEVATLMPLDFEDSSMPQTDFRAALSATATEGE